MVLVALIVAVLVFSGSDAGHSVAAPPVTFHCTLDAACPAITIAGDPFATIGPGPSWAQPVRAANKPMTAKLHNVIPTVSLMAATPFLSTETPHLPVISRLADLEILNF